MPALAAIICNSYTVLSWDCCLFSFGVAQSASHQVQHRACWLKEPSHFKDLTEVCKKEQ